MESNLGLFLLEIPVPLETFWSRKVRSYVFSSLTHLMDNLWEKTYYGVTIGPRAMPIWKVSPCADRRGYTWML